MSTKTTFKRVALVAVAALGLGVLTSVAPATAIQRAGTSVTVGTPGVFVPGQNNTIPVTFTLPAGTSNTADTITVIARVISAPAASNTVGSAASGSVSAVTSTAATSSTFFWGLGAAGTSGSNGSLTTAGAAGFNAAGQAADGSNNFSTAATYVLAAGDLAGQVTLRLSFRPDVAGSYTIMFTSQPAGAVITNENAARQTTAVLAGYTASSVTITTGAPATTVALTSRATSSPTGTSSTTGGVLLRVAPNTPLSGAESITLTGSSSTVTFSDSVLTAGEFTNGVAFVNVHNSAAETISVTASQSGTLTTLTPSSIALTYATDSTQGAPTIGVLSTDLTYATGTSSGGDVNRDVRTNRTSFPIRVAFDNSAGTAAFRTSIVIHDVSGKITGLTGARFSVPVSIAAAGTSASVTVSAVSPLLNAETFTATLNTSSATNILEIQGKTSAVTAVAVTPSLTVRAAAASTNAFTATFTDQFGSAVASEAVTVALTGRNAVTSSTLITNALGQVTYSVTDAGTAGTSDSLSFTSSTVSSVTRTVTINYGTTTVTTMTLTGGNTTAGVTSTVLTLRDIDAGIDGASTTTHSMVATLRDAAGALMAGVPVTWTVSGTTGAAITSTTRTTFSGADGTATAQVYGWTAGTYTVTATAGATTATGTITFGQVAGSAEARVLSATVNGQVITAKVVDRYGNPVSGVALYAVKSSGTGYFGNGVSKVTDSTDADGVATFAVAGGDAAVTVSTINWTSAPGTVGSGQTAAPKGFSGFSATAAGQALLALTATTVGTTTTAETGVGASFDAAGVSSVAVEVAADGTAQAAADAAAEATDAANAATDAANAAAEAADAATAAAQDAADAVAALATSVEAMVNALKRQITSLTNLVIKIQKKVRA
jgi:trimeric autotransporter adhesin